MVDDIMRVKSVTFLGEKEKEARCWRRPDVDEIKLSIEQGDIIRPQPEAHRGSLQKVAKAREVT